MTQTNEAVEPQDTSAQAEAPKEFNSEVQLKPIESMDQFFSILSVWHSHQMQTVNHFMNIPDGTEVTLTNSTDPLILTGDALRGFQAGLSTAMDYFGTLPISQSFGPEEAKEEQLSQEQLELALVTVSAETAVAH
jgi:hypothetical protein